MNTEPTRGEKLRTETTRAIFGIEGRAMNVIASGKPGTVANQKWICSKEYREEGERYRVTAHLRFDDKCGNGRDTFSATADIDRYEGGRWHDDSGGCLHDEIARHFPALAPLLPYHLTSTDGPMHYVANTVYLAGDRDHNGLRKGETRQIRNGRTGKLAWRMEQPGKPETYIDSDTCPPAPEPARYVPWLTVGEGKARELDAARRVAIWPDATDAQLCAPKDELTAALQARLPSLLAAFRRLMVEECGFLWQAA